MVRNEAERDTYKVVVNTGRREYKNYQENIRIVESENPFKLIVARVISDYLLATSRPWDTVHKSDVNSRLIAKHLNSKFPEFKGGWEARALSSQQPFDVVFLGTNLIIEVKSAQAGTGRLTSNATVYPDRVRAKYALPNNFVYPKQRALFQEVDTDLTETNLDVIVVCVEYTEDVVTGFAIVDGHYWGVTEEMYLDCRDYFADLNEIRDEINTILAPENTFAQAMLDGSLGDGVDLYLRKLIFLTNPIGRLNVLGKWGTSK